MRPRRLPMTSSCVKQHVDGVPTGTPSPRHVEEFYGAGPHVNARLAPERSEDAVGRNPQHAAAPRAPLAIYQTPLAQRLDDGPLTGADDPDDGVHIPQTRDALHDVGGARVLPDATAPSTITAPHNRTVRKDAVRAREVHRRQELFEALRLVDVWGKARGGEGIVAVHE
jgi:hypothetical protein